MPSCSRCKRSRKRSRCRYNSLTIRHSAFSILAEAPSPDISISPTSQHAVTESHLERERDRAPSVGSNGRASQTQKRLSFASPQASSRLPSSCPTFIHGLGDIVSPTEQRTQYGAIYDDHSPQRSSTGLSPQVTFSLEYAIKSNDIEGHETVRVKEEDMPVFSYFIDQCGPWVGLANFCITLLLC